MTEFGIQRDHENDINILDYAWKVIAIESRAAGIVSMDTPYVFFKNPEGLKQELSYLKSIGMKGKFAIHPS